MGKYRTFLPKVIKIHGLGGCIERDKRVSPGNGQCDFIVRNQSCSGILPVRSQIEWQKWKRVNNCRGTLLQLQNSLLILLISSLLFIHPCYSIPTPTNEISSSHSPQIISSTFSDVTVPVTSPVTISEEGNATFPREVRNCTPPSSDEFPADLFTKEQRQNGAITIHFFVSFYMLYALLLVCDEYFVPSIERICTELRVPHNIAGATFMAISTSAPELFTNVIGTFVTKGDLGVGTIVGSAVFNVLAVGSCVGIGTAWAVRNLPAGVNKRTRRKGVPLDWWSLSRDSGYYMLSVIALVIVLFDGRVYWQEATVMLVLYGLYILGMCYDNQCKQFAETFIEKTRKLCGCKRASPRRLSTTIKKAAEIESERSPLINKDSNSCQTKYGSRSTLVDVDIEQCCKTNAYKTFPPQPNKGSKKVSLVEVGVSQPLESSVSSTDSGSSNDSTLSTGIFFDTTKDFLTFPVRIALACTIPDCRKERRKNWYGLTLLCCVGWIAALSYMISWMVCIIGDTFNIPDTVTGLTFLAAGTSLPEVLSSVIVARQGLGSMGLSNSVGSNTFDILVCLGLPWLIQSAILTSQDTDYIEIHSGGLEYSVILLITSMFILYVMIAMNSYILDFKVGVSCVIMYAIFITVACLFEMNVFFPVNLPPC